MRMQQVIQRRARLYFFQGGISETEILIAYGPTCFASKAGQLAGNHFLTIEDNLDVLAELGARHSMVWSKRYSVCRALSQRQALNKVMNFIQSQMFKNSNKISSPA
jgi:hypothetical protein